MCGIVCWPRRLRWRRPSLSSGSVLPPSHGTQPAVPSHGNQSQLRARAGFASERVHRGLIQVGDGGSALCLASTTPSQSPTCMLAIAFLPYASHSHTGSAGRCRAASAAHDPKLSLARRYCFNLYCEQPSRKRAWIFGPPSPAWPKRCAASQPKRFEVLGAGWASGLGGAP